MRTIMAGALYDTVNGSILQNARQPLLICLPESILILTSYKTQNTAPVTAIAAATDDQLYAHGQFHAIAASCPTTANHTATLL